MSIINASKLRGPGGDVGTLPRWLPYESEPGDKEMRQLALREKHILHQPKGIRLIVDKFSLEKEFLKSFEYLQRKDVFKN